MTEKYGKTARTQLIPPILFLIFNRPETERKVFEAIRKIKPNELYVAADGPRDNKAGESNRCTLARKIVDEGVDWECNIHKLYRDKNLGCKLAVSSAIDWFFKNVKEGIILEDDCLPDPSFFLFCSELLEKYREKPNVMHISGSNFQNGIQRGEYGVSYYFSKYPHIWGWATWRRAWIKYSINIEGWWNLFSTNYYKRISLLEKLYWISQFYCIDKNLLDTWDYQWVYAIWKYSGKCITPNTNMVLNIGIGKDSTHTKRAKDIIVNNKIGEIKNINHPNKVIVDFVADMYTLKNVFDVSFINLWKILAIIPYRVYKNLFK